MDPRTTRQSRATISLSYSIRSRKHCSPRANESRSRRGKPAELSVVRLDYILRGFLDSKTRTRLTIEHPLSRYDSEYFSKTT